MAINVKNNTKIKDDIQDRNCDSWLHLLEAIDRISASDKEFFDPRKEIGDEHWKQIFTLPRAISKLTQVKKIYLYGSQLLRIPPEIGDMVSLEEFIPYASYGLRWFPYEITRCKLLRESTVSTRVLFGNSKNKKPFPDLTESAVNYHNGIKSCSICNNPSGSGLYEQYWVAQKVGSDILPLLVNSCSVICSELLMNLHKGGRWYSLNQ